MATGKKTGKDSARKSVQQRSEALLRLEHGITLRLSEAAAVRDAVRATLREVCRTEQWDLGEFWMVDEAANLLRRLEHWVTPGLERALRFIESSRDMAFERGVGLIGAVWRSGEPEWLADAASDPRVVRKDISAQTGLRSTILFPVRYGGRVTGVLAFVSARVRRPDGRLLQSINVIATQLGQFLQRAEAEQAMRESEARFRSLTNLSSDYYWELDAEYRFTRLEGRQVAGGDRALHQRLMGNTRWDTGLEVEGGWPAHQAQLEQRLPFHDVLMWRTTSDGARRYLRVSGEPVFDADGGFTGYRGIGRDYTAQKRAEDLLRLEHHVGRLLSEADDARSGLLAVMRAVCDAERWACARYFEANESGELMRMREAWCVDDPGVREFIERSREIEFRPGDGLVGAAWERGGHIWCADSSTDPRVHPQRLSEGTGIRGAFVFPVLASGRIIGMLAFASQAVREPDERLLRAAKALGHVTGQFLQRKRAEEALRESEARFRSLTEMSSDFFWETDAEHRFTEMVHGPNYVPKFGLGVVGRTPWDLLSSTEAAIWIGLRATFEAHEPFRDVEFSRPWPDGGTRYFAVSGEPRRDASGAFLGYRGVGRETTEIALAREHIASLAYSDPLTGLANRTSLGPGFDQAVERARRRGGKLAAIFIDLDGFKPVNDAHGHQAGDRLLIEVARRLSTNLRASDLIARLGGDEFFVVLEDMQNVGPLEAIARKLLAELQRPYELGAGKSATEVSASMGISIFPDDASDSGTLMKHADTAMYEAKQAGKNGFRFYSPGEAVRNRSNIA